MANTYNFPDPFGGIQVPGLVGRLISATLAAVGAIFFVMFLLGGLQWLMAGGTSEHVKKAKQTLVNAVIGLTIVVLSYTIVNFVVEQIGSAASGTPPSQSQPAAQ